MTELIGDDLIENPFFDDEGLRKLVCRCKKGLMEKRDGKYGQFLGCSRFPKCSEIINLSDRLPSHDSLSRQSGDAPCPRSKCNGILERRDGRYGLF